MARDELQQSSITCSSSHRSLAPLFTELHQLIQSMRVLKFYSFSARCLDMLYTNAIPCCEHSHCVRRDTLHFSRHGGRRTVCVPSHKTQRRPQAVSGLLRLHRSFYTVGSGSGQKKTETLVLVPWRSSCLTISAAGGSEGAVRLCSRNPKP